MTVITRTEPSDPLKDFEMRAALILANYLQRDLIFQRPRHRRTPDLKEKIAYNNEVQKIIDYFGKIS